MNASPNEQLITIALGCTVVLMVLAIVRALFLLLRCVVATAGSVAVSMQYHQSIAPQLAEWLKVSMPPESSFPVTCAVSWVVAMLVLELGRTLFGSAGTNAAE